MFIYISYSTQYFSTTYIQPHGIKNNGELDTVKSHTLEVLLQLARLVDKERSQISPTLWPLTTHLQLASKERRHFPACSKNQMRKKTPKATKNHLHLSGAFPSPASLAARSHSAIRVAVVFVVLGPSQRRGRTTERKPPCRKSRAIRGAAPAASYSTSPLPARARAVFGSPKNLSNLNSKLSNFPTCQHVKILLPNWSTKLISGISNRLTKLDDVKLRTSNKTAGKFMAGLSCSNWRSQTAAVWPSSHMFNIRFPKVVRAPTLWIWRLSIWSSKSWSKQNMDSKDTREFERHVWRHPVILWRHVLKS